jgi:hypothetical protein
MAETSLTFTCSTNNALLLLAFYDVITDVAPEDSIASVEHAARLIDEIGSHAVATVEYLDLEEMDVPWQLRALARVYEHLPRRSEERGTP